MFDLLGYRYNYDDIWKMYKLSYIWVTPEDVL